MTPALTTALSRIASTSIDTIDARQCAWLKRELAESGIRPVATTPSGDTWRLGAEDQCGITLITVTLWRSGMGGAVAVLPPEVHVDYSATQEPAIVATPEAKRSSNGGRELAARLLNDKRNAELRQALIDADDIPDYADAPAWRGPVRTASILAHGADPAKIGSRCD